MIHLTSDLKTSLQQLEKQLEAKYKGLTLFVFVGNNDNIKLEVIRIPKELQNQGVGSKVINALVEFADTHGKLIYLTTAVKDKNSGTTSQSRLIKFYKQFGFVENKGRNMDYSLSGNMYREPK